MWKEPSRNISLNAPSSSLRKLCLDAGPPAILPLAAHPAFPRGLPHWDFFADGPTPLANFFGYREYLGAKGFGVLDLDPRAVTQDNDAKRGPLPVPLLDEEEVGPELEPVPVIDSLR
jgi:hypothetical protein